ncbi:hypothetical protein RUND412_004352 [Rhizina undulata]
MIPGAGRDPAAQAPVLIVAGNGITNVNSCLRLRTPKETGEDEEEEGRPRGTAQHLGADILKEEIRQ